MRAQQVLGLADALRSFGIDANVDLYHGDEGVDWARFGPRLIDESDFTLVVLSSAWRAAWEGKSDPTRGAGAAGETNALLSMFQRNRDDFTRRVRLVLLPGSTDADVPTGLHNVTRYVLTSFDLASMSSLLRDLTGQPQFLKPPLGPVPKLPPEGTARKPPLEGSTDTVDFAPLTDAVELHWLGERSRNTVTSATLCVHINRVPGAPISSRLLADAADRLATFLRSSSSVAQQSALTTTDEANAVRVEVQQVRRGFREPETGSVAGVRLDRSGQLSVWFPLPADSMGAVLDRDHLAHSIALSIRIAADLWHGTPQLAFGFELASVTMITTGKLADLGHRSSASLSGAMRSDLRIAPDEVARSSDFVRDQAKISNTLAAVVLRSWGAN
jgi:hypothetical protein